MSKELGVIDSGILQFTPKGAYYETEDEQYAYVKSMWLNLFRNDRTLFSLVMLLKGTGFSKGEMSKILLSNPLKNMDQKSIIKTKNTILPKDFEKEIITYALYQERTPRALKNLLMLTTVNNSRTRKLILEYIFNRSNNNLDFLAVNYKKKLQKLIRHALGKQDLYKILNKDIKTFQKHIGRYNNHALPVIFHIFNKKIKNQKIFFPMIENYSNLKIAAQNNNTTLFKKYMKKLPIRTVMGMRNLYKVKVDKAEVLEQTQKSTKDTIQMQAASKKVGAKIEINFEKQDIYDLIKFLYFKLKENKEDIDDKLFKALENYNKKIKKINIGECVVIEDVSHSMMGNRKRPMHPFLTAKSIILHLDNIKKIIYIGGKKLNYKNYEYIFPGNSTNLAKGLIQAVSTGVKNIVIISDGYENTIKGMFNHVYKALKKSGYDFKLIHINPVFSSDSLKGTSRRLVDNIKPIPIENYKYLETEIIFSQLIENKKIVKNLLIKKYQNLIGGIK